MTQTVYPPGAIPVAASQSVSMSAVANGSLATTAGTDPAYSRWLMQYTGSFDSAWREFAIKKAITTRTRPQAYCWLGLGSGQSHSLLFQRFSIKKPPELSINVYISTEP